MSENGKEARSKGGAILAGASFCVFGAALWLRFFHLSNIPGINGDEAWYGVQALKLINGEPIAWRTPTIPWLNPFYIGLVYLVHLVITPSELALRLPAVLCGIAALVVNYEAAKRLFGQATANISTIVLAVLPASIMYSRLGWDAAETPLAIVLVLYASLAIVCASKPRIFVMLALLACGVAVVIHPVNLIAGIIPLVALAARHGRASVRLLLAGGPPRRLASFAGLALLHVLAGLLLRYPLREFNRVFGSPASHIVQPAVWLECGRGFVDLLSGISTYRYIAGSNPQPAFHTAVFALLILWAVLVFAWTFRSQTRVDKVLWLLTALTLLAFFAFTGTMGFEPHRNRYALLLVPSAALCFSRSLILLGERIGPRLRAGLLWISLALGALILADCYANVFHFIRETGGRGARTYRTAEEDPKFAAARFVKSKERRQEPTTIYAEDWWLRTPAEYYAVGSPHVQVYEINNTESFAALLEERSSKFVWGKPFWLLLYPDGENYKKAIEILRRNNALAEEKVFADYAGNPVVAAILLSTENRNPL